MRSILLEDNYSLLQLENFDPSNFSKAIKAYDQSYTSSSLSLNPEDLLLHTSKVDFDILSQIQIGQSGNRNLRRIGDSASPLPAQILADPKLMDELRQAAHAERVVLNPMVLSREAALLAQELGISMTMRTSGVKDIEGIYPNRKFLEENPVTSLNSKATQVGIFAELDKQNGTNFTPESIVARNVAQLTTGVASLLQQHDAVILKESLSCGGNGVYPFSQELIKAISKIIGSDNLEEVIGRFLKAEAVNFDEKNPLVVQELVPMIVCNPSIEMFVPPKDGFQGRSAKTPWVTYTGRMIIQEASYLGIQIPDPLLTNILDKDTFFDREVQYVNAFNGLVSAALAIARAYQDMGYVGIMDCDCGIAINAQEQIFGKVFESNIGRETGGTLPHLLLQQAGLGLKSAAMQVLNIQWGNQIEHSSRELIQQLNSHRYIDRKGGFVVTAVFPEHHLFSGIGISTNGQKADRLIQNIVKAAKKF